MACSSPWRAPGTAAARAGPTRRNLLAAAVVGALLLLGGNGLVSVGEQHIDSGFAALLVATVPVWMVLVDAGLNRTRVSAALAAGLLLGTAGVAVLVGGPGGRVDVAAAALVLVASVSWALGSVWSRTAPMPAHPMVATAYEMLAGGVLLVVVGAGRGEFGDLHLAGVSGRSLLGLGWLIGPGSLLAFTAYVYALRTLPTDVVATYAFVNPVVAVALGAVLLGESLSLGLLVGGGIVVAAVAVILRARVGRRPPGSSPADEPGGAGRPGQRAAA